MKSMRFSFTLSLIVFCAISLSAQGIEFFHGTWAEALEKAKSEEKLCILVWPLQTYGCPDFP